MNKFTILPNRIKQPAICCVYCGKGYKSRTGYEKHAILCELIDRTKKKKKLPKIKNKRFYFKHSVPTYGCTCLFKIICRKINGGNL